MSIPRPDYDVELEAALPAFADLMPEMTLETIPSVREAMGGPSVEQIIGGRALTHRDVTIAGCDGDEIVVTVLGREGHRGTGPGIYYVHGGGMVMSNRFSGADLLAEWVERWDAVGVTVEHRLLVAGMSSGGGLTAGIALLARDRGGPALAGQILKTPMLDDRAQSLSSRQYDGTGFFDRAWIQLGWRALLGDRIGTDRVPIYAAPARAPDLAGLPPTFIDVGSAEVFRDEAIAYAGGIWAAGGAAELHVWSGGFHGFDLLAPYTAISRAARAALDSWLARRLAR